jgi:urea transport system substrate-binding protein
VFEDHDNLLLYPAAYEGLETSEYIVYLGATPNQYMLPAVKWAYAELDARRFVLVGTDALFSKASNAIIRDAVKKAGAKLIGEVSVPPGGTDMSRLIPLLKRKKPDLVLSTLIGDASHAALFDALKVDSSPEGVNIISFNLTEQDLVAMNRDQFVGHHIASTYFQSIEREQNLEFLRKFRKLYGHDRVITPAMAAAYASVHLWAKAVVEAKSAKPEAVRPALRGISYEAPGGVTTVDVETGHASQHARISRIEADGKLKLVYASLEPIVSEPFPASRTEKTWRTFIEELYIDWANRWEGPSSR